MKIENENAIKIVDTISEIRTANNVNWVNILKLAIAYAPRDKVLEVLRGVDSCDTEIGVRFIQLIEELEKES